MSDLLAPRWARGLVQLTGIVRKELLDVLRQPRLVAVLVIGPFLILVLFGIGYDRESTVLTTAFVGPEGAAYEQALAEGNESLERYVRSVGYSSDVLGAQERVESGEIDLVVQFPPNPSERVLDGEQAIINVFHEKIDPIQQSTVEISATLAVLELNAEILANVLGELSDGQVQPADEGVAEADDRVAAIRSAVDADDLDTARTEAAELETALGDVRTASASSVALTEQLGGELTDEQQDELSTLTATTTEMSATAGAIRGLPDGAIAEADRLTDELEEQNQQLAEDSEGVVTLDPAVLTRPFRADAENLQREPITADQFFAPNAIALLLAHLALTIAAMGLVRGEALGLFEVYRVGPMGTRNVVAGTYLSYLLLGGAIAAALIAATVLGLDVPLRGDPAWLVPGMLLLVSASVGLGIVVALVARSDTQAVQLAMLVLLAGLFFGGFFLDLELFSYPVRGLAWALPVTYGISLLQDVMLRGDSPALIDWLGLVGTTLVYGVIGTALLDRRLRIRAGAAA